MSIDLHQLEVFVEVSRTRNIARAADNLGLTSSPVSRTLRALEKRTGLLFHREHHDMRLTGHGRALLGTAVSVLQLSQVFEDKATGTTRTLRYGMTPWVPDAYAEGFLTAVGLSGVTPQDAASGVSVELLEKLVFGEIDMALVHLPVQRPDVSSLTLGSYTFDLMVAADDPLVAPAGADGQQAPVDLSALHGRRVVTLPFSQMQPTSGANVHDWFRRAGVTDVTEIGFSDYAVLPTRLARTHEVSIRARGHHLGTDGNTVVVPVREDQPRFEIGVVWRSAATSRREEIDRVVAALTARFLT